MGGVDAGVDELGRGLLLFLQVFEDLILADHPLGVQTVSLRAQS